jgi:hypothetical protein
LEVRGVLFTSIFLVVVLIFCWLSSEVGLVAKLVLTLVFFAHWLLMLWTPAAVIVAQCILIVVIGVMTFGSDFLTRRVR